MKRFMRYLLGLFFVLAGINHFWHPAFYTNIMPNYLPWHYALVLVSGATEIAAGVMLFFPQTVRLGAWGVVAMLVIFLSVHIDMIVHADRFASIPVWGLWLRLLLQFPFIAWGWWFTKPENKFVEEAAACPN